MTSRSTRVGRVGHKSPLQRGPVPRFPSPNLWKGRKEKAMMISTNSNFSNLHGDFTGVDWLISKVSSRPRHNGTGGMMAKIDRNSWIVRPPDWIEGENM